MKGMVVKMSNKVLVETSARHVHITEEQIEILFGAGAKLTHKKDLSQPGQYACEERVTIVGPKKPIANVIILGPARGKLKCRLPTPARSELKLLSAKAAMLPEPPDASL